MTAAFDAVVKGVRLLGTMAGNHLVNCTLEFCCIETWLYGTSPTSWEPARLLLEDSFHHPCVRCDAFVNVHLEAAEHDCDESDHVSRRKYP